MPTDPRPLPVLLAPALALGLALPGCGEGDGGGADPRPRPAEAAREVPAFAPVEGLEPALAARIESLRDAVRAHPRDPAAWGELGLGYHANDLYPLALDAYARAAELEPASARWPYMSALVREKEGLADEALSELLRAEALASEPHAPLFWRIGGLRLARGELDEAQAAFERATRIDPRDHAGWFGLARVHLQRREPEEAIRDVRRGIEVRPEETVEAMRTGLSVASDGDYARALLGEAYRQLGRWDDARRELEAARDAQPFYFDTWEEPLQAYNEDSFHVRWVRATFLYNRGRLPEAIQAMQVLHAENPENRTVTKLLATALSRTGRSSEADELFEAVLAEAPDDREALAAWVEHCLRTARPPAAREALERLLAAHPENGHVHFLHGRLLEAEGKPAEAIEAYRASLYHDQRNAGTHVAIGRLALELRRWEEARDALRAALDAGIDASGVWLGLGRALTKLGELEAAADALARARTSPGPDLPRIERAERELRSLAARAPGADQAGGER